MSSRRTLAIAMLVAVACVGCTPEGAIETETDTSSTMARTAPARVYEGPPVTLQAELSGIVRIDTGAGCVSVEVLGNPSQLADVIFPEGTTVDLSDPSDPVIEMSGMRLRDGAGVQLGGGSLDKARYPAGPDDPPWCDDDDRVFVLSGDGRTVEPEIVTTTPPTSATTTTHGCMGTRSVESVYTKWTKDGKPTGQIEAWPFGGFGPTWLLVHEDSQNASFYLRADPEDETLGPSDDGLMDALRAGFARGIDLPVSAEFTGFATAAVEVWIVADEPDAVYIVPLPGTGLEVERWPAMPFPAFCH